MTESKDCKEDELNATKNVNNDYDLCSPHGNLEKEEPMDDHDTETEMEAKGEDTFEEESEDEDIILPDNTVQPGPFRNVDSIVCLGTEPDKAMVKH